VIIPARNEEKNIRHCIESFPNLDVIVVDDASQDRTAQIATEAGATVIAAPPLSKGAMGKPNACWAGALATNSEWILFVDADTSYSAAMLPSLLQQAKKEDLGLLSVFLRQERLTIPEKVVLPYAFALYFCGVNATTVNSMKSMDALANGQCMLFRREVYNFIGGHKAVLGSIIEDMKLAHIGKQRRIRQRVMRAEKLGSVRMYEGFQAIWRGFEKNSVRFLLVNKWCGAQVVAASILLTSYLPVLGLLLWKGNWILAAICAMVPIAFLYPWYGGASAMTAPLAIYLFQLIALSGMVSAMHGKSAVWKGRRI
jgi:glycosyltransferase involved in cell wall biosynthesis